MTSSVAHKELKDTPHGISLKRMASSLAESLCDFEELNKQELYNFGLFCFAGSLQAHASHSFSHLRRMEPSMEESVDEILQGDSFRKLSSASACDLRIDLASFLTTYHIADNINLTQAVQLFDRDLRIGWIEDFFTPTFLRSFYREKPAEPQELKRQACDTEDTIQIDVRSQDSSENTSRCSGFRKEGEQVQEKQLREEPESEGEQDPTKLHKGIETAETPWLGEVHQIGSSKGWQEDVLNRINRLELCMQKLMPDLSSQSDLHTELALPTLLQPSTPLEVKRNHKFEDKQRIGAEANQTSQELAPTTSAEQLRRQQQKLVAAHTILLEIPSYHDDCLKKVMESVERLSVKIHEMDTMIQNAQIIES